MTFAVCRRIVLRTSFDKTRHDIQSGQQRLAQNHSRELMRDLKCDPQRIMLDSEVMKLSHGLPFGRLSSNCRVAWASTARQCL